MIPAHLVFSPHQARKLCWTLMHRLNYENNKNIVYLFSNVISSSSQTLAAIPRGMKPLLPHPSLRWVLPLKDRGMVPISSVRWDHTLHSAFSSTSLTLVLRVREARSVEPFGPQNPEASTFGYYSLEIWGKGVEWELVKRINPQLNPLTLFPPKNYEHEEAIHMFFQGKGYQNFQTAKTY